MPSALPCGKSVWSWSSKASSVRPSKPGPKRMVGLAEGQVPKSRAPAGLVEAAAGAGEVAAVAGAEALVDAAA